MMLAMELAKTQPAAAFAEAIDSLERRGMTITPADIPGLVSVDGKELTMGQIFDLARHQIIIRRAPWHQPSVLGFGLSSGAPDVFDQGAVAPNFDTTSA